MEEVGFSYLEADNTQSSREGGRIGGQMEVGGGSSDNIAEDGRAAVRRFKNPENANIDMNLSNSIFRPQKQNHHIAWP